MTRRWTPVIDAVLLGLERARFPWVPEGRDPTEAERHAAVVATAALLANRRTLTARANESKEEEEEAVKDRLVEAGLTEVARRWVHNLADAPPVGTFCAESQFGTPKSGHHRASLRRTGDADRGQSIQQLHQQREAAQQRRRGEGPTVDSGVRYPERRPCRRPGRGFKLHNLRSAQNQDRLTVFWAHRLDATAEFIEATKPGG